VGDNEALLIPVHLFTAGKPLPTLKHHGAVPSPRVEAYEEQEHPRTVRPIGSRSLYPTNTHLPVSSSPTPPQWPTKATPKA
jgi:hypothetical protein